VVNPAIVLLPFYVAGKCVTVIALIVPHHLAQLFWVERAGEHGRVHQITKQHSELAAFRLWRVRSSCGDITVEEVSFLEGRRCGWGAWGGEIRGSGSAAAPDQDSSLLVDRQASCLDQLGFQIFDIVVIESKLAL
jgi:hypothetical protein